MKMYHLKFSFVQEERKGFGVTKAFDKIVTHTECNEKLGSLEYDSRTDHSLKIEVTEIMS